MPDFDYIKWEWETTADTWVDISADVVGEHSWNRCDLSNDLVDKTAHVGRCTFRLNNSAANSAGLAGYYSPNHTNARANFGIGHRMRLTYCYDNIDYCKFIGTIYKDDIQPIAGQYGPRITIITATDIIAKFEESLDLPTLASNKTASEVVALVMTNLDITPAATSYGTMSQTFPAVFDTTKKQTAGIQEVTKAIVAEWGFFLSRMDRASGETIVVQGRTDRDAAGYLQIPIASDEADHLLLEDGDDFLLEDGGYLLLDEVQDASLTVQTGLETSEGASQINYLRITVTPRDEDADTSNVLCQIENPILLDQAGGPKEETTIRLKYTDPDQQAQSVTTKEMQSPVPGTDLIANTKEDGTGINTTASLSCTPTFGAAEAEFHLKNLYAADSWVRVAQGKGKGIYLYAPIDKVFEDATSIATYKAKHKLSFALAYVADPRDADDLGDQVIALEKDPILNVLSASYKANRSSLHMMLFLFGEPGHMIAAAETQTGVDRDVFIQGISVQSEATGGIINVTYPLIEASRCSYT